MYPDQKAELLIPPAVAEQARAVAAVFKDEDWTNYVLRSGGVRVALPEEGRPSQECHWCHNTWDLERSFSKMRSQPNGYRNECRQCRFFKERLLKHAKPEDDVKVLVRRAAEEAVEEFKADLDGTKGKITRSMWPADKTKRIAALTKLLPRALMDYDGQEARIAAALTIPITEIKEAIDKSKDLQRFAEHAKNTAVAKVEAALYEAATKSGNIAGMKFWLTNNAPERYSDRSSVEVRNVGFTIPEDEKDPGPILKIVNRKVD